jgi:formylglycine-generating enzyme required for sulfatase activity
MPGKIHCPNCKNELPAGAKFCHQCGEKTPVVAGSGPLLGDVGLIHAGTVNIGAKATNDSPTGDYCPICGEWVKTEDSFRCKSCERAGLHVSHRHAQLGICSECVVKLQPDLPTVNPAKETPKKQTGGNRLEIPLGSGVEMEFVRVPAGVFLMGEEIPPILLADKNLHFPEKQHKVYLEEYWIGKTPVTNDQYQVFVKAKGFSTPFGWVGDNYPNGEKDHPVVNVSWHDAVAFCEWLSEESGEVIRLPSEAEWEKTARGTDGRTYPWGEQGPEMDLCNYDDNVGKSTKVGSYSPRGDSPYGCVDMIGNVAEWTSSLSKDYPYKVGDGREDSSSEDFLRVYRGGNYYSGGSILSAYFRDYDIDECENLPGLGFRCALSPS